MARRTQVFQLIPWSGGVNSAVDPGVLPAQDLVQADNVIFAISGSRLKREGRSYLDTDIPAVTHRSSSGTTRTLVFASSVNIAVPVDQILVSGEAIIVSGSENANYNTAAATVASITTTNVTNDTITYTFSGAASLTESSTEETLAVVEKASAVIAALDFWYYDSSDNEKVQEAIGVTSQGKIFRYDNGGRRTELTLKSGATALTGPLTSCDLKAFNEKLIMAFSGVGNTPKMYDPSGTEYEDLPGNPPDASLIQEHLGRLWLNDKENPDDLHYSPTFNHTKWQGDDDSGKIPIAPGDGDPDGITAIQPPYKGRLIVQKGTKTHQLIGTTPENIERHTLSTGLGSISHKACVAIDLDDNFFMSRKGIHSLIATDTTGDFEQNFLSAKIQPTFNKWSRGRYKFTQAAYDSTINSVAYTVAEDGQSEQNAVWLFNITNKEWYRWPNFGAQSVTTRLQDNRVRLMFGDNRGRLFLAQNGTYTDFGTEGISFRVKTGTLYPDGNPQTIKRFNKVVLLFKPRGRYSFSAYFKVDNFPAQPLVFEQTVVGDELGEEFVLGESALGADNVLAPFTKDVHGHGRGCTLEIFQAGPDAQVEIYGLMIDYEVADLSDETLLDQSAADEE